MIKSILVILLTSLASITYSQDQQPLIRKGVVFGTSIGVSHTMQSISGISQNNTDFAFDLKVGYMLNPNLALLFTSNVSGYEYTGIGRARKRDFGVLAPAAQYWLHERLWVMGGVGLGIDSPVFFDIKDPDSNKDETAYYSGLGAVAALGYELYQSGTFAIDIKARLTYRNVDLTEGNTSGVSPSILIGVNFY